MRATEFMNLQNTVTSHCMLNNTCLSITGEGLVVGPVQGRYDQALTQYFSFQWATIQQQMSNDAHLQTCFTLHTQNT